MIFDGIPRNITQAHFLKEKFSFQKSLCVNIILEESILIEKLLGRRVCINCGRNYNYCEIHRDGYEMEPLMPEKKDQCDDCGNKLVKREDDKEEIIHQRIDTYNQETHPVMQFFKDNNLKILDFEPKRGIKDYPLLKKEIDDLKFF